MKHIVVKKGKFTICDNYGPKIFSNARTALDISICKNGRYKTSEKREKGLLHVECDNKDFLVL